MPKECRTIKDKQNRSFDEKVNEALAEGWEIQGGVSMCERGFFAVLLTRDKPDGEEGHVPAD